MSSSPKKSTSKKAPSNKKAQKVPRSPAAAAAASSASSASSSTKGKGKGKGKGKSKRLNRRVANEQFSLYIYRLLKNSTDSKIGIGKMAMGVLVDTCNFVIGKFAEVLPSLLKSTGRSSITVHHVQSACRIIFPDELSRYAISEATKAVAIYNRTQEILAGSRKQKVTDNKGKVSTQYLRTHPNGTSEWLPFPTRLEKRAGLNFSVGRVTRAFKSVLRGITVRTGARIYLTAAIEYIMAEILELSEKLTKEAKRQRIKPRHINVAIQHDNELAEFFKGVGVTSGGKAPPIPEPEPEPEDEDGDRSAAASPASSGGKVGKSGKAGKVGKSKSSKKK